jgi:hypothetical protein
MNATIALVLALFVGIGLTLEIKVVSNELPYETAQQIDLNTLRLAINFNTRYVYPSHHSTFAM